MLNHQERKHIEKVRIVWVRNIDEIQNIQEYWVDLETGIRRRTYASTFDYVFSWYKSYSQTKYAGYGNPLVGIAKKNEDVVGIAPLFEMKGRFSKIPVNRIEFAGFNHMEGEFLLNDDMPDLVENFINDLINMKEHHIIGLNRCDLDGDKYIVIENIIRNKRLRRELTQTRYAFVDLRGGYDSYCRSMSKNFRRNLNRHEEKICSAGSIRIERMERYCDSKNISKYLSRMFNISLTGWRAKEFGIEEERHHQNFHDYFFPRLALKGMLDISILCIDDKDIAYIVGIIENGVYYEIVTAYNELFKDLSPGTYLIQEILKWCDKNKIHTLISNGDHEYKKRWATEMISQGRLIIFLPGFRSHLGYVAKKSLQPLYYNIKNIFVK